jgi:hypothetical protein
MTLEEALGYFEELHFAYVNEFCCSAREAEESRKEFAEAETTIRQLASELTRQAEQIVTLNEALSKERRHKEATFAVLQQFTQS